MTDLAIRVQTSLQARLFGQCATVASATDCNGARGCGTGWVSWTAREETGEELGLVDSSFGDHAERGRGIMPGAI